MASFSSNLVQDSNIFISLVSTFVILQLALCELQFVLQYIVIHAYIAN
jgi:hypothetical protein